ncbi:MAG: endonuclease/exonuclease/phosphatase family protein [Candidatus Kapaibacteriota bacterium]
MVQRLLMTLVLAIGASTAVSQDVISIADARKQEFGSVVAKVAGRVTAANVFRNTAYIEDGTAGVAVFNAGFNAGTRIGDSVIIENATLIEFQATTGAPGTGLTELAGTDFRFTVVPVERIDPRPKTTTIPLVGENEEGMLIRLRRVTFLAKGSFQSETNYDLEDSQGNLFQVRIDGATDIARNSLPIPTEPVDVIGCVSQFRGAYQMFPRFATDIGLSVEEDTVSKRRTLDVTSWNLEWYGTADTARGPRDKDRQRRSIRQVMDSIQADIYALQEVLSQEALDALSDSVAGLYGNDLAAQVTSDQKMAYIYNRETITPLTTGLAVNGGAQAWANGRYPFRMTFDATIDGTTKRMVFFTLHGKATSDSTMMEDYERRKADAETFHQYLADFYADTSMIIMGDLNDALGYSIVDSTLPSPFANFINDTERWWSPTLPMEERGLKSYIGFASSFLDHALVTTDLQPFHHRTFLEAPQAYLSSYSSTVSDHLPVTSRYFVSGTTSVDDEASVAPTAVRLAPMPMVDHGMAEIVVEHGGPVHVELVSMTGETLVLLQETLAPQIRLVQLPVHQLSSGRYALRVSMHGRVDQLPVVIHR